ncbi:MAG: AsnC family transcriptional regulator [Candidatus Micrarchaeaceae archaeon]
MSRPPKRIYEAFQSLKGQYDHIYLKCLNGNYYVYRQTYEWRADQRKSRTISEYIGRITSSGAFVKRIVSYKNELEKAEALIVAHGGKIIWSDKDIGEKESVNVQAKQEIRLKDTDHKILMALSMNARMPITKLARFAGLSKHAVYSRVKALKTKLGIKYKLEFNVEKLGYLRYLVLVKFESAVPALEEIAKVIAEEPQIQFAATTKGEYDIVMYIIDENPLKAYDNLIKLRQKEAFSKYKAFWTFTYFAQSYSFIPVRGIFIDQVLEERVWHRAREASRRHEGQLRQTEYMVLKELNEDSSRSFAYIDQKCKLNKGAARYTYNELIKNGIIERPTISMAKLPFKYIGILLVQNIDYKAITENRYKYLLDEIEYGPIANKYCLSGNIGAPNNGVISFLPVLEGGSIERYAKNIENELQGSICKSLVVTWIITGELCYRRFDNDYSRQYKLLIDQNKIEPRALTNYY